MQFSPQSFFSSDHTSMPAHSFETALEHLQPETVGASQNISLGSMHRHHQINALSKDFNGLYQKLTNEIIPHSGWERSSYQQHFQNFVPGRLDPDAVFGSAQDALNNAKTLLPDFSDPNTIADFNTRATAAGFPTLSSRDIRELRDGADIVRNTDISPLRDIISQHNANIATGYYEAQYQRAQNQQAQAHARHRPYLDAFAALKVRVEDLKNQAGNHTATALPKDLQSQIKTLGEDVALFKTQHYKPTYALLHPSTDSGGGS